MHSFYVYFWKMRWNLTGLVFALRYRDGHKPLESFIPLAATIRELLRLKVFSTSSEQAPPFHLDLWTNCIYKGITLVLRFSHFCYRFDIPTKSQSAGNEAFKSGRHTEAVEHYTAALSCNVESRSFTAVCFCNRSAAYKALGQLSDAIADCSLAIALDQNYSKVFFLSKFPYLVCSVAFLLPTTCSWKVSVSL